MTVAIGLVCADGVVVASDSMSSSGAVGHPGQKVKAVPDLRLVWTASGAVYIIEEVEVAMADLSSRAAGDAAIQASFSGPALQEVRTLIADSSRGAMGAAYGHALPGTNAIPTGLGGTMHPWHSDFLFAGFASGNPYLLEVAGDGQLNWHTTHGFASVGSGGPFAEVARGLMAHYVEGRSVPVDLGLWVAYRAIETTCRVSTQFVGPPVQLAVVDADGARVLDQAALDEVEQGVAGWLETEKETLQRPAEPQEPLEDPPRLEQEGEAPP